MPIVPGEPPAPPAPVRRRWWILPAVLTAFVLVGGGSYFAWSQLIAPTPLRAAYGSCSEVGQIADGDRTLILDLKGRGFDSGAATADDLFCVLAALDAPAYVRNHMEQTRALDGRQTERWGNFEAAWTYHPDNGLDVTIRDLK